jgi:methyl-accepting chemotaxis protein
MLRNHSIVRRLLFLIGLAALVSVAGVAAFISGIDSVGDVGIAESAQAMLDGQKDKLKVAVSSVAQILGAATAGASTQEDKDRIVRDLVQSARFEKDGSGYYFVFRGTVNVAHPAEPRLVGTDMGQLADRDGVAYIRELANQAGTGKFVSYVFEKPGRGDQPKLSFSQRVPNSDLWIGAGVYVDDVDAQRARLADTIAGMVERSTAIFLAIVGLLFFAVVLPLGVVIARSISRPLGEAVALANRVAEGKLTERIEVKHNDEVGQLQASLKTMTERLRDVLANLQSGVGNLSSSSSEISATAKQSMATASEQAATVTEIGATIEEIDRTSRAVAEQAHDVVTVAEQAVDAGRKGITALTSAAQALELISKIVDIVDTVNELAEQSNLLAVNASIEASRAGEHGLGFAVVASEVHRLAQQSKRAAKQIREILGQVEKGGQEVSAAEQVIRDLARVLESAADKARQISGAAGQQASGINQISEAMENVVQGGRDTAEGAKQLEGAVSSLSALAQQLKEVVSQYET